MGRLEKKFSPDAPDAPDAEAEKSLRVDIFRHGQARYKQEKASVRDALDLTDEGIKEVRLNAEKLADLIHPDEEVEIWSSPMGRTLHTAKIVAETLEQKGARLRKKGEARESGIKVFEQLSEVKNFLWSLFAPLVTGGEVEFAGKKFFVDKKNTNPDNLDYAEYFVKDGIKNISSEARAQLPPEYVQEIDGFEKFIEATGRMMKPLSRLKKLQDKSYRVIIVTHDALTGFIANVFSGGEKSGINPGEFINLERKEGKLLATGVGNLEAAGKDIDIIEEFNRRRAAEKL